MKFFIGYLIGGEAARWHRNAAKDISEKFNTWKIYEKIPAHITIFYPFPSEDISQVKKILAERTSGKKVPGNLVLADYGHFDDKVVFAQVEVSEKIKKEVIDLQEVLQALPGMPRESNPISTEWHPHATLAYRLSPQEIEQIWQYVQILPKPDFTLPFDNITIFRYEGERKWDIEQTFKFS